ncbi:ceramide kinase-like [Teleopsis dalmanni]|uniref:ceramide kinase-like n=1 Tax=Teleopsis dalmanni TaxID=139649 RepID=UPI0018CF2801|nr:ceramide kinase-like [Teleopsis dalmanni]
MTQASKEFATQTATRTTTATTSETTPTTKQNCDILLNNFQIKKKQYRVLLNNDHIVWERLDANRSSAGTNEKITKKELEFETEQLSNRAANAAKYGSTSKLIHINEVIHVAKGNTKSATCRRVTQATSDFNTTISSNIEQQRQQHANQSTSAPTEQYLTIHYAERINKSPIDCNRWHIRALTLYNSDPYVVRQWHALLQKILNNSTRLRVQRLLVFINPFGGRKQGLQMYERYCKPVFELAGVDASCIISQRANQIRDILMSHDLGLFDAVCCVGGDGTVAEVINGLVFRAMRDLGIDAIRPAYIPKPALPVGIIPAGSTDTVAYSLHGTSDVRTAAIHVILGQRRGLDICSVRNRQGIVRFCASAFSYGYLGDVAAKSERYRWMGTKRYEFTGVKSFLLNRGYEAEIRMLLESEEDVNSRNMRASIQTINTAEPTSTTDSICYAHCQRCSIAPSVQPDDALSYKLLKSTTSVTDGDIDNQTIDDMMPRSSNISLNAQLNETKLQNDQTDKCINFNMEDCDKNIETENRIEELLSVTKLEDVQLRTEFKPNQQEEDLKQNLKADSTYEAQSILTTSNNSLNNNSVSRLRNSQIRAENWKIVKGQFFMITGANITCACTRSPNGVSRYSHLGDGTLDLVLVRKTSLISNVRLVLNMMGRTGDIRNLPFVEVYRTKKFSFRTPNMLTADDEYSISGSCQPITATAEIEDDPNVSSWNCDGEVVTDLDVTMISHCQLIDVFMRGPYSYTKPTVNEGRSKICCCFPTN